jgi:hypothetical protein
VLVVVLYLDIFGPVGVFGRDRREDQISALGSLLAFVLWRGREWWVPGLASGLLVAWAWRRSCAVDHGSRPGTFPVAFVVAGTMFKVARNLSTEDRYDDCEEACYDKQSCVHERVGMVDLFRERQSVRYQ